MKVECGQVKKCGHEASLWGGIQGDKMQGQDIVLAQCFWGDLQEAEQEKGFWKAFETWDRSFKSG